MTQIVITGVAGFIGSTLSEKLLEQNYDVLGIDSITDYYPNKIKEKNLEICLQKSNFTFFSICNREKIPFSTLILPTYKSLIFDRSGDFLLSNQFSLI